jgi:hypothetical protein
MKRYQRLRTVFGVMSLVTTARVLDQFELRDDVPDDVPGVALVHSGVDHHLPCCVQ